MKTALIALLAVASVAWASAASLAAYASVSSWGTDSESVSGFVPAGAGMYVSASAYSQNSYASADITGPGGLHVYTHGGSSSMGGTTPSSANYNVAAYVYGYHAYATAQIHW